ncbi:MAG: hypothetical protein WBV85_01770 [Solirubrobacteraceae bacterium]
MGFPGHEQDNPQRVSAAVNTAGFAQDVVMATSRLIHDQTPTERDREALDACRALLKRMLSTDITFVRSGEHQLAAINTVALLRKARSTDPQDAEDLERAIGAIENLLAGQRDPESIDRVRKLREKFLAVGEDNLAAMTRRDPHDEASDTWTTLIANSVS